MITKCLDTCVMRTIFSTNPGLVNQEAYLLDLTEIFEHIETKVGKSMYIY